MDASQTGRGAETVYRDKQGRVVDEAELKRLREADKKPGPEAPTWGAGIKQVRVPSMPPLVSIPLTLGIND
jgi:hypothetical protein